MHETFSCQARHAALLDQRKRPSTDAVWESSTGSQGARRDRTLYADPPPPPPRRRSRSSAVMHVTPELEVLGSNPSGVGTSCPRR